MDSPETWRWIWLVAALLFTTSEMATAGHLFLLPFGIGAAMAALLSFAGVGVGWTWLVFVIVSFGLVFALVPLRKRLDRNHPQDGIGSRRLLGQSATVLQELPAGPSELGLVRVGREEWRAESLDGTAIPAGTVVRVVDVRGTRVVVFPQTSVGKGSS
jgi:membrane protein implicated in regulation of membrane protease activity